MEPWYMIATPRKEVCEGRSFNPDELAIALEQVVAGTAPGDYRDPAQVSPGGPASPEPILSISLCSFDRELAQFSPESAIQRFGVNMACQRA
jgi:hypothetical protein